MRRTLLLAAPAAALLIAGCASVPAYKAPAPARSPSAAAASLPVFRAVTGQGGTVTWTGIRPSLIGLSGDGGNVITGIKWSSWTVTQAVGYGTRDVDNCKPNCAEGTTVPTSTKVALSDPVNGVFTVMVEDTPGDVQEYQYPGNWALDAEPAGYKPPAVHMSSASPSPAPAAAGSAWAVVSEFYGDVESGDYRAAWALLAPGARQNDTERQFASGYSCTGQETLTEDSSSGDTVTFSLQAQNTCTGQTQNFSGTETVSNGKITAATITAVS